MNDERITFIAGQGHICDRCAFNMEVNDAVVQVVMRTDEHPRFLDQNLCGNHAEVAQIPDEPLKK